MNATYKKETTINEQLSGMSNVEIRDFLNRRFQEMLKRSEMAERADEVDVFICSDEEFVKVVRMAKSDQDLDLMATIQQFRETWKGISGRP